MTVGEYAGVPLQNSDDTWRHGAVFLLRKSAARRSTTVLLPNGWLVSVVDRTNVVVVCGPSVATSFDDTFAEALEAANHALDFWSIGGESDHAIREAPDDCLVWWPDPECGGTVMRCKVVINVSPRLSMTGHVTDADGNVPPPPPPPPPPTAVTHDAFRFVRMSRTSTDLFDAYRNLFLAFEVLLSEIRPRQRQPRRKWLWIGLKRNAAAGRRESERKWFMDALDEADKFVSVRNLLPPHVTNLNAKKWIYRHMYQDERSALMHAKQGEDYRLPHDSARRKELTDSLGRLWHYVESLIEERLGVRHSKSSFPRATIDAMAKTVLQQHKMVVADANSEGGTDEMHPIPSHATLAELHSSAPVRDPKDSELWTVLAVGDPANLAHVTPIRSFGLKNIDSGASTVLSEICGPLALGSSVSRIEMLYGVRHVNPSGAPRWFPS
ncbi:hypothetical protein [Mycolicibacterium gadium]|nr:hypothetical protein [Mycolicibacterium gadium]